MDGTGYDLLKGLFPLVSTLVPMVCSFKNLKKLRTISFVLFVVILIFYLIGINHYGADIWKPLSEVKYRSNYYRYSRLLILPLFFTFILSFKSLSKLFIIVTPSMLLLIFFPDEFLFDLYFLTFKREIFIPFILPFTILTIFFGREYPEESAIENNIDDHAKEMYISDKKEENKMLLHKGVVVFIINLVVLYIFLKLNNYQIIPDTLSFHSFNLFRRNYTLETMLLLVSINIFIFWLGITFLKDKSTNKFLGFLVFIIILVFFGVVFANALSIRVRQVPDFASTVDTFNLVENEMIDSEDALIYNGIKDGREVVFIEMYRDMDLIVWNYQQYKNGEDFIKTYVYNKDVIYFYPGDYEYTSFTIGYTTENRDNLAYYHTGEVDINHPYIYQGE